jgi:hypothetical protein
MPILSTQSDISPSLKKNVPEVLFHEGGRQIIRYDAVEDHHPHSTSDVVSNEMRQYRAFTVHNHADWHWSARMKVGRGRDSAQFCTATFQRLSVWQRRFEIGHSAHALALRFIVRHD